MNIDRRVERTKRDLKYAYLYLLETKQSINITIKEIVTTANYNRATFYAHYHDKDDLIYEVMEDAITQFIQSFREPYMGKVEVLNLQQLSSNVIKIFDYVERNASMFKLLFNNNYFPNFQNKLCQAIERLMKDDFDYTGELFKKINKDLYFHIEAYSIIAMFNFWIENDFKHSAQYMAEQLIQKIKYSPSIIKIKSK